MNGTESRFPLLRYLSLLVVNMSWLAALLAVITLLVSFTGPNGALWAYLRFRILRFALALSPYSRL